MPGLGLLSIIGGVFGLKGKAAGIVGAIVTIVAVLGLLWGAKALYDHSVISNHDAKQDASNSKADRKADQKAATTRRVDDSRLTTESTQLQEVSNAPHKSAADRRVARQRCLRLQQSARAANRQPPPC